MEGRKVGASLKATPGVLSFVGFWRVLCLPTGDDGPEVGLRQPVKDTSLLREGQYTVKSVASRRVGYLYPRASARGVGHGRC